MEHKTYTGSCHCQGVQYQLTGPLRPSVACHCQQCRKTSGHYWSATSVPKDRFALIKADTLQTYRASDTATRSFCKRCGASLFWEHDDEDCISIGSGTLDADEGLITSCHIFVADKGHYYTIEDDLPQYAADIGAEK